MAGAHDELAATLDVFYEALREGGSAKAQWLAKSRARRAAVAAKLDESEVTAAVAMLGRPRPTGG